MTVDPGPYQPMTPPPAPPPVQKSTGCGKIALIGCSILLVLAVLGGAALVFGVFGVIKRSDIYTQARDRASSDPRVIAALGQPIKTGWMVSGSVEVKNQSGNANLSFPISGPKGDAKVEAVATRDMERWNFTTLTVRPANGPPINVLTP
jgi:Fungal protein of unknown function (DUF1783).